MSLVSNSDCVFVKSTRKMLSFSLTRIRWLFKLDLFASELCEGSGVCLFDRVIGVENEGSYYFGKVVLSVNDRSRVQQE